ncbi:MAG: DNA-packaging protein [Rhodopseudomonas sp.]|uniref:DNA-packaging protein n=1 Tax=Rhodopseudomonas sp. TaxID=1078 RepID=UPI00182C6B27|nr:terminase family protein [Rhodopseudomonas sp.]NVN88597.1 DNA-packaging protein [Rhodopseudomonas sp.]
MSLRSGLAALLADTLADGGWRAKARPSQLPPPGDWNGWAVISGRGFGKTWVGSNWTNELAETGVAKRIALIGATASDVRDTMIEGESGILATAPSWNRPQYEPSKRRLTWSNGAMGTAYSSEEADRLRGPQHDFLWGDELAAWNDPQSTWDMAMFGLRLGQHPRWLVTTTPRPIKLLKQILAREGADVVVSRGSTYENAANLAGPFLDAIRARYEGTRLGRQELNAELLLDHPGALWTREMIEQAAFRGRLPDMKRVVVAVDPSGTRGEEDTGDSVGIVVAGLGTDDFGYVLADRTCKLSPAGWGRAAVDAYREFKADRICAERNFGGAMVEHVIRTVDPNVSYREVTASRGKIARAEPIASLYEQGRVRHVAMFPELEDQMTAMTGDGFIGGGSPDRCDALVWALTELMTKPQAVAASMAYYSRTSALPLTRLQKEAQGWSAPCTVL